MNALAVGTQVDGPVLQRGGHVRLTDGLARIVGFESTSEEGLLAVLESRQGEERVSLVALATEVNDTHTLHLPPVIDIEPDTAVWQRLPQHRKDELLELARHLTEMTTGDRTGSINEPRSNVPFRKEYHPTRTKPRERVLAKVAELEALAVPGFGGVDEKSLYRKRQLLRQGGVEALMTKYDRRGTPDPLAGVSGELITAIESSIAKHKDRGTKFKRTRFNAVRADLRTDGHNALHAEMKALGERRLRRIVQALERGLALDLPADTRRGQQLRKFGMQGSLQPTRPGELVQIDATRLNAFAFDPRPNGGWVQVEVLVAIDCFDGQVLALRCTPLGHTARDVARLLYDMYRPKVRRTAWESGPERRWHGAPTYISLYEADDRATTPTTGTVPSPGEPAESFLDGRVITAIVMDHGKPMEAQLVLGIAARCGTEVLFARPGTGPDKPFIEAFNNFLAQAVHNCPAYKGPNVRDRGKADQAEAVLLLPEFEHYLWECIHLIHHNTPARGLRPAGLPHRLQTPNQIYDQYIQTGGVLRLLPRPDVLFECFDLVMRNVESDGVEIDGSMYDAPCLDPYRGRMTGGGRSDEHKVAFYIDYDASEEIYFYDRYESRWQAVGKRIRGQRWHGPWSDLHRRACLAYELDSERARLTKEQRAEAEQRMVLRWGLLDFKDVREARLAAYAELRHDAAKIDHRAMGLDELLERLGLDDDAPALPNEDDLNDPVRRIIDEDAGEADAYLNDDPDDDLDLGLAI